MGESADESRWGCAIVRYCQLDEGPRVEELSGGVRGGEESRDRGQSLLEASHLMLRGEADAQVHLPLL